MFSSERSISDGYVGEEDDRYSRIIESDDEQLLLQEIQKDTSKSLDLANNKPINPSNGNLANNDKPINSSNGDLANNEKSINWSNGDLADNQHSNSTTNTYKNHKFIQFDQTTMQPLYDKVSQYLEKLQNSKNKKTKLFSRSARSELNAIIKEFLDKHDYERRGFHKDTCAIILTALVIRFPALYEADCGGIRKQLDTLYNFISNETAKVKVNFFAYLRGKLGSNQFFSFKTGFGGKQRTVWQQRRGFGR